MSEKSSLLGFGLGLRIPYYEAALSSHKPLVDWWEVISENFLNLKLQPGGRPFERLLKIREKYPLVMHGVSLSIGGTNEFSKDYLKGIKELYQCIQPEWVSDHLCWTGVHGKQLHDLLPLPYNQQTLNHVCSRIHYVQEYLGRSLVIENVSSYISYKTNEMSESEFLCELVKKSGIKLLLDVNNVYVSSVNHTFNAENFIKDLPIGSVQQLHLAGHSKGENLLIDTHDAPICPEVWELYSKTLKHHGRSMPVMIERDANLPDLEELLKELSYAKKLFENTKPHRDAAVFEPSVYEI